MNGLERQVGGLKSERDKLIGISSELKAQVLAFEKQKEMQRQNDKVQLYKQVAAETILEANVKESKLDQLKIEVEQMREMVNKFRFEGRESTQVQIEKRA